MGRIPNGANVERAVLSGLPQTIENLELVLDRADFTTVRRAADAALEGAGEMAGAEPHGGCDLGDRQPPAQMTRG